MLLYRTCKRALVLALFGASLGLFPLSADGAQKDKAPQKAPPKRLNEHKLAVEIQNPNQLWKVSVSVDRADKTYGIGDEVVITVNSEQDGYLYLFNVDTKGEISCIFPNQYQKSNEIKGGQDVVVPDPKDRQFRIKTTDPGTEVIKAIVTKQPLQELKMDELTRGVNRRPLKLTKRRFGRLAVEAMTGQPPPPSGGDDPIKEKDKFKQDHQQQYQQQAKLWAQGQVELQVIEVKKEKPDQKQDDKPDKIDKKDDKKQDDKQDKKQDDKQDKKAKGL